MEIRVLYSYKVLCINFFANSAWPNLGLVKNIEISFAELNSSAESLNEVWPNPKVRCTTILDSEFLKPLQLQIIASVPKLPLQTGAIFGK